MTTAIRGGEIYHRIGQASEDTTKAPIVEERDLAEGFDGGVGGGWCYLSNDFEKRPGWLLYI